jgi:hypothetical protein
VSIFQVEVNFDFCGKFEKRPKIDQHGVTDPMVNVRNLMRLENFHHKIKAIKQSRKKLHSNSTEISSLPNRKLIIENVTVKKCQLNQIDNMEFTKQIHTQINISLK